MGFYKHYIMVKQCGYKLRHSRGGSNTTFSLKKEMILSASFAGGTGLYNAYSAAWEAPSK